MSTFSQYGIGSLAEETIVADESYSGLAGAYRMAEENLINENNIFNAIIHRDFSEVACEAGMISESALEVVNEASLTDIWNKVIEFIKSVGKKILGIIVSLKDKIQSIFIRDGKELVKKYGPQIKKKLADPKSGLSKMKYKYSEFHGDAPLMGNSKDAVYIAFDDSSIAKALLNDLGRAELLINYATDKDNSDPEDVKKKLGFDSFKPYTEDQKTEFTRDFYTEVLGGSISDSKEFAKEFDKAVFSEAEEKEGIDSSIIGTLESFLQTCADAVKSLDKDETATKKAIKDYETRANKVQKKATSISSKNVSINASESNALASRVITLTNIASTVTSQALGLKGAAYKKQMKQARSLYIKAATFTGTVKESAEWFDAVDEVCSYEVDEMFA